MPDWGPMNSKEPKTRPVPAPRLRFPGFDGEWEEKKLRDCLDYKQPTDYLVESTNYDDSYETPVLTAGKTFILGYTNEKEGIFDEGLPVIIFDDFTTATQFVEFPFKAKSSAMKILSAKPGTNIKFAYEVMHTIDYQVGAHERHWISNFSKIDVPFPSLPEQTRIAAALSSLDAVIAAHQSKQDALREHKRGLMAELFPAEGERVPRLRFPEFEGAGEWEEKKLGELLLTRPDYGLNAPAVPFSEALPTYLRITDISEEGKYINNGKVSVQAQVNEENYLQAGEIVLARTGASVGKSYLYKPGDGRLVFAGFLIRLRPNPEILDSSFLSNFLTTLQYWEWVAANSARSGQPGINSSEYSGLPIPLPSLPEQQRIAACLSSLDDLIAAQSDKITALQEFKQG